ncbi:MAG: chitobiase/beta-hexosaminidase C-terminal domain-containing protein, partial [Anaerolineae bacterium]|nr:chitobiase/beta-hexosaminidase C-terminal domain-containing protein [Anaerolineae bacterium]
VVAVTGGSAHSVALKDDGTVWAWGLGGSGQLGNGGWGDKWEPTQVVNLSNVIAIASGTAQTYALKADGTVWAWGRNDIGQLGDGTTVDRCAPVSVSGLAGAIAIAGGEYHGAALCADGAVWAWGFNSNGQVGDGTRSNRLSPRVVQNLHGVIGISAGTHNLAQGSDGSVWSWGYNQYGQLGNGTLYDVREPAQITGFDLIERPVQPTFSPAGEVYRTLTNVVINCPSTNAVIHYTTNGTDPTVTDATVASGSTVSVSDTVILKARAFQTGIALSLVRSAQYHSGPIAVAGANHSFAVYDDGSLWAWGNNNRGQLGDGSVTNRLTPEIISGMTNVVNVAAGLEHSLILKSNGTVMACGNNDSGQLGDTSTTQRNSPVSVS